MTGTHGSAPAVCAEAIAHNAVALRCAGVEKRYGNTCALSGVTLEVRCGECFGLVGINGAGKTTLLKCLLDFCEPDGGAIDIFGVPHRGAGARSRLAFLPERFVPPYYLTGRDFIRYVLELHSLVYEESAVGRILAALDLDRTALALPVRAYSKGMTQKLGLAACLLSRKELLVLDEPTGGLDPKARALFKAELHRQRKRGATVFLTSHALADVEELCDRMAVLHAGRLLFAGTPESLRRQFAVPDLEQAFLACIAPAQPAP